MAHKYLVGKGLFKKTLEQAYASAEPGDWLVLDPDVYEIGADVVVDGINIRGNSSDPSQVVIKGSMVTRNNVMLENLSILMDTSFDECTVAIYVRSGQLACTNCYISGGEGNHFTVFCDSKTQTKLDRCTVIENSNAHSVKAYGNARINLFNSSVQGAWLSESVTGNLIDSQIIGNLLVEKKSKMLCSNLYSVASRDDTLFDVIDGSQFVAEYLNLPEGNNKVMIKHGLLDVKRNNIDESHRLLYQADEQSTVSCEGAEFVEN